MSTRDRTIPRELYTSITAWQTRVLRLHSGQGGDPLQADLLVAGLLHDEGVVLGWNEGSPVFYDAISYSWGTGTPTEVIVVNGLECLINECLAGALRRFRRASDARYLWADALCINQADTKEKSVQVRNMLTIYRRATSVLAWLGETSESIAEAIWRFLNDMPDDPAAPGSSKAADEADLQDQLLYESLAEVALRPWARRAWIQQEVFAARTLTVYCGDCQMTLEQYWNMVDWLSNSPIKRRSVELGRQFTVLAALNPAVDRMLTLESTRLQVTQGIDKASIGPAFDRILLEYVLLRAAYLEATDPRDLIHALLNLTHHPVIAAMDEASPASDSAISIDYSMSVSRTYQRVTKSILNRDRSLRVLINVSRGGNSRLGCTLPTWVVDWTSSRPPPTTSNWEIERFVELAPQTHNDTDTLTLAPSGLVTSCL